MTEPYALRLLEGAQMPARRLRELREVIAGVYSAAGAMISECISDGDDLAAPSKSAWLSLSLAVNRGKEPARLTPAEIDEIADLAAAEGRAVDELLLRELAAMKRERPERTTAGPETFAVADVDALKASVREAIRLGADGVLMNRAPREYMFLPDAFAEVTKGYKRKFATGALIDAGWLKPGNAENVSQSVNIRIDQGGKTAQKVWSAVAGKQIRVYVFDGDKMRADEDIF